MLLALFTLTPDWKQPGCPLLQKGSNRVLCLHSETTQLSEKTKSMDTAHGLTLRGKARTGRIYVVYRCTHRWAKSQRRAGSKVVSLSGRGVAPHLEGVRESEGLGMFSPDPGEVVQKPVKWPI